MLARRPIVPPDSMLPQNCQPEEPTSVRALIVDDDEAVKDLFAAVLAAEGYEVDGASSAEAALALLARERFDIMLIDTQTRGADGLGLLERARALSPDLPIVLIAGQADVEAARLGLASGAKDLVTKPCNVREIPAIVERNLTRQALARRRVQRHPADEAASYESVLDALLSALDTRATEADGHPERVTAYAMLLARSLGVTQEEMRDIERGALLHDIGKIGVPDRILLKPGPLTADEWVEMKRHPVIGYRMCAQVDFLAVAAAIVLHHHERWDGSGYPDGLSGEQIPLGARIFAVADAFDAMTTDRPYRMSVPFQTACDDIRRHSGTQFDPRVVKAFLSVPEADWQHVRRASGR